MDFARRVNEHTACVLDTPLEAVDLGLRELPSSPTNIGIQGHDFHSINLRHGNRRTITIWSGQCSPQLLRSLSELLSYLSGRRVGLRVIRIVRPEAEAPLVAADEVGVVFRHAAVVHHLLAARVADILNGQPLPVVRPQLIANPQLPRRRPTPTPHPERMLRRRPQDLPANHYLPDHTPPPEHLLHAIPRRRPGGRGRGATAAGAWATRTGGQRLGGEQGRAGLVAASAWVVDWESGRANQAGVTDPPKISPLHFPNRAAENLQRYLRA